MFNKKNKQDNANAGNDMVVFALIYPTLLKINLLVIWQVDLVQKMKLTKKDWLCAIEYYSIIKINIYRQIIFNT